MKVVLKTIAGKKEEKEFAPDTTMLAIKEALAEQYENCSLRFCYKGAVLEDTVTLEGAGLSDGDVIVVVSTKKKVVKEKAPTPSEAVAPTEPEAVATTAQPPVQAGTAENVTATASASPDAPPATAGEATSSRTEASNATATATAPPAESSGSPQPGGASAAAAAAAGVSASLIDEIVGMGFPDRGQVALALRAAYLNSDRAVEYLCSDIPPHVLQRMADEATPRPQPHRNRPAAQEAARPQSALAQLQQAFAAIPQFNEIRALVQSNPETLPVVIEQLRENYPNAYALAVEHPEEFRQIVSGTAPQDNNYEEDEEGPRTISLQPTQADAAPIQRLLDLGGGAWDLTAATVVYLACNRNEEVAANVLFDNNGIPPQLIEALQRGSVDDDDEEGDN